MNNERQSIFKLPRPSEPLAAALQACRTHFVSVVIFSALLNLLVLVPMLDMLQVYDRVVPTRGVATLALISVVLVFALGTMAVLDMVRTRLLVRASVRLDRYLSGLTLDTALLQRLEVIRRDPPASHQGEPHPAVADMRHGDEHARGLS